jgi:cytidylate kinase
MLFKKTSKYLKKLIIAIDGYSSCGKSTLAKALASYLHYRYIDSGAMYRCVTLYALQNNFMENFETVGKKKLMENLDKIHIHFEYDEKEGKCKTWLNGEMVEEKIRSMEVSKYVSRISEIPEVRRRMADLQRAMGKDGGIVMDGRDIGTNIFPNADVKFFMTAQDEIRAQRRFNELKQKGIEASFEEVLQNLKERDYLDTHRKENPLIKSADAITIDNSFLTEQEQFETALEYVRKAMKCKSGC